jgi:hypothetical protein
MNENIFLLEYHEGFCKYIFNIKTDSFEFVDVIDNMDLTKVKNYKKRDAFLKKHGRKIFKKHPIYKNKEKRIQIKIENLNNWRPYIIKSDNMHPVKKTFTALKRFINDNFDWKISINIEVVKNRFYDSYYESRKEPKKEEQINGSSKEDFNDDSFNIPDDFLVKNYISGNHFNENEEYNQSGVLSQDEIDQLLGAIRYDDQYDKIKIDDKYHANKKTGKLRNIFFKK